MIILTPLKRISPASLTDLKGRELPGKRYTLAGKTRNEIYQYELE
jgi:hypothetical protein